MKKIFVFFCCFATILFMISCGGGKKDGHKTDTSDSGETVNDSDVDTADTGSDGGTEHSDTAPDDGDPADVSDTEAAAALCTPNPCGIVAASTGKCTEKEGGYECECLENYTWKEGDCIADSRRAECKNLPENASWNNAAEISQTWNGSMWEPPETGVYGEEASTTECRFKCLDKYEWNGAKCEKLIPQCNAENAGKTCKDYETGYIWSAQSAEKYNHENILTYCEGLATDDLSWRAPDIDELRTIIRNCGKTVTGGTCPVSVEHFDYDTYCRPNADCKGCTPEEGIEYNIFGTKKGDPYFRLWSSTQAHENSISYYTLMFSSDTYMASISPDHTSSWNIRCLGSGQCPEHYELNGNFECVPATRIIPCEGLPENAVADPVLNGGYNIVQTWDEESGKWLPEETQFRYCSIYNPYECCFHCPSNMTFNQQADKCEQNTRVSVCDGLPANAEWNTTDIVLQTQWGDGTWLPTNRGYYNTNQSTTECRFKCKSGFWWTGTECQSKIRTAVCKGLPANAEWNTAESITQKRTDSGWWTPSDEGFYNTTASTTECRFKCKSGFEWNGSGCGATVRTSKCTGLPSNAQWNTVSEITQTKDSNTGEWLPAVKGVFSETASDKKCFFKCSSGYAWDNVDSACKKIDCGGYIENNGVCKDASSGLVWSPFFPTTKKHSEAEEYCANLSIGGYSDWRLPTLTELRTTVKNCEKTVTGGICPVTDSCANPYCYGEAVDASFYDDEIGDGPCECPEKEVGFYSKFNVSGWTVQYIWSSTLRFYYPDGSEVYWIIDYVNAYPQWYTAESYYFLVRCVR